MSRLAPKDQFSPREHHEWSVRLWRRMDRDMSGFISKKELDCEEFRSTLRKVVAPATGNCMGGPRYMRAQLNMDMAVSFFIRKADISGDGLISFEEFKSFMGGLRRYKDAIHSAGMVFALFDTNTDGVIDEGEFREIFRFFLGHDPTENEFQVEWSRLDADGDGRATRDEYIAWLQTSQNPVFRLHGPGEAGEPDTFGDSHFSATVDSAELRRGGGAWRPWDAYTHFCWSEPTKGKPSHTRMKFRDNSRVTRSWPNSDRSSAMGRSLSSTSAAERPEWNPHLATSHPNWPDEEGRPRQILGKRQYFMRPQSLPELSRHLESRPGLKDLRDAMLEPQKQRKAKWALSHEHQGGASQVLSVASRSKPAGYMRHPYTRERKKWDDHWHESFQLKNYFHPPPKTHIGAPPKHLYADLYEDEQQVA